MKQKHLFLFLFLITTNIFAQNIPVGSIDMIETRLRNEQLLGKTDSLVSFTLRPLSQSVFRDLGKAEPKSDFQFLAPRLIQQLNTLAPSGWNDGAMIPAKGYQSMVTAGLFYKYGLFNIQLKPEYVYAVNPDFETFPLSASSKIRQSHIYYLNHTDNPDRLGEKAYSKLFWGQSRIALDYKKISLGVSTENLWWGPGQRNSLIMSNNAPGFLHFTLNTKKPIQTFIGSFEGQLISGKLESSNLDVPEEQYIVDGINYKQIKSSDWRYLNALSVNYQPKWIPGLFLGLNRVFQIYHEDLGHSISDYLPVITPFQKNNLTDEDTKRRDQVASLYFRWFFKEANFEFYAEKGWNDHKANLWDLFESPEHAQANLIGFSKIFKFNSKSDRYMKLNFENTQIQQSADRIVRQAYSWYIHGLVWHGYTNQSQVMGAGIGPSGNSQTIDCSLWNKENVWGVQLERFAHNMDFYYDAFTDYKQKWIDLNLNLYAYQRFGNLGVHAKLNNTLARHYQWFHSDKYNLQLQLGLQYFLN